MRGLRAILGTLVILAAGCGASSSAGRACTVNTDCDPGETCYASEPGGFCSKGCAQSGLHTDCPNGTICAHLGTSGDQVCAPTCSGSGGCRAQYACSAVQGSTETACQPM